MSDHLLVVRNTGLVEATQVPASITLKEETNLTWVAVSTKAPVNEVTNVRVHIAAPQPEIIMQAHIIGSLGKTTWWWQKVKAVAEESEINFMPGVNADLANNIFPMPSLWLPQGAAIELVAATVTLLTLEASIREYQIGGG